MLPSSGIHQESLGFKKTNFRDGNLKRPARFVLRHRQITPGSPSLRQALGLSLDNFAAQLGSPPEIGAQQSAPSLKWAPTESISESEIDTVTDEPLQSVAGRGCHVRNHWLHVLKANANPDDLVYFRDKGNLEKRT